MRGRGSEQHHWLRLSSHILQENINAAPLEAPENEGTLHFEITCGRRSTSPLLALTLGSGRASFSIGCIIWLTGCIIWAGLTVIFHCDVATGDSAAMLVCLGARGTDAEMFAKEEGLIAPSAGHHCAHAEPSFYPPSPYLQRRSEFENTKKKDADRWRRKTSLTSHVVFFSSPGCDNAVLLTF